MFFKSHGTVQYKIGSNDYPLTDITKASVNIVKSNSVLQTITVDGRTPEQVSADVYDDPKLFWTILMVNNIIDPFIDWYMLDSHLYDYCLRIYGSEENMLKIKYFRNTRTDEILTGDQDSDMREIYESGNILPEDIEAVSFYDYQVLLNENKKSISIIPKANIIRFVEDFKKSLKV